MLVNEKDCELIVTLHGKNLKKLVSLRIRNHFFKKTITVKVKLRGEYKQTGVDEES